MLPLEFVSKSVQPPLPIFPVSESPPTWPTVVMGNSLLMRPNEVRAVKLYPAFSGRRTWMGEKEVLAEIFLQPDEPWAAVSITAPF